MEIFMNTVQLENRNKVSHSISVCTLKTSKFIFGYEYEDDGHYTKQNLSANLDEIAKFICSSNKDKLITDGDDYAILNTMGTYVDLCIPTIPIDELIFYLRKYQK